MQCKKQELLQMSLVYQSDGQVKSDYSELPAVATLTEEFAPILHFLTVKDLLVHIFYMY